MYNRHPRIIDLTYAIITYILQDTSESDDDAQRHCMIIDYTCYYYIYIV